MIKVLLVFKIILIITAHGFRVFQRHMVRLSYCLINNAYRGVA